MMPWQLTMKILAGETYPLYGAGKLKRDWTYVDDIVAGIILSIDAKLKNEILNIGCGCPVENLEFVQILESLLGKKARMIDTPTPPSEPLITYADVSKAKRLIGYEPKVSVAEGLKRFVEWMRGEKII